MNDMNDLQRLKYEYKNSFTANMVDDDQLNKCIRYINALEHRVDELEQEKYGWQNIKKV